MNEQQRLFHAQARSCFVIFDEFRRRADIPSCHALHYLQMATEMLGKAYVWRHGPPGNSHRAFVRFLRTLRTNRQAQNQLGYDGRNENWEHLIRKSVPLAESVEDLAPALAGDGPNPEYPWPRANPASTPVEFEFDVWLKLQQTAAGRQFLHLVRDIFSNAEVFL